MDVNGEGVIVREGFVGRLIYGGCGIDRVLIVRVRGLTWMDGKQIGLTQSSEIAVRSTYRVSESRRQSSFQTQEISLKIIHFHQIHLTITSESGTMARVKTDER